MDKNLKLRKAVIIAIALFGTGYSLHSKAIGLGDIQVKSYLGQPLSAQIKVYGIDSKMDESCFNVNSDDTNAISEVKFKLKRLGNEQGLLTLSSNHAILEPIASLTVINQCDTPFTRQYNLLIDPSISSDASSDASGGNAYTADNTTYESANVAGNTTDNSGVAEDNATNATKAVKRKSKRKAKRSSTNVEQASNRPQTTQSVVTTSPTAKQPKLIISGASLDGNPSKRPSIALMFDSKINTSREVNPQAYSEEAEFSDELTVMNNRLAHLDKQLSSLSMQNATLTKLNKQANADLTEAKSSNDFLRTLSFILGGGLLASSYFFVDWLRRRNADIQAKKQQAVWETMVNEQEEAENKEFSIDENFSPVPAEQHFEVKTDDDLSDFEKTHIFNSPFSNAPAPIVDIVEEGTRVIEDADVFLSHGRTGLAIQLVQSHLIEKPKESASTWFFLLDLLAKEGMQHEYEVAAKEFNKHFNIQVADFSQPLSQENTLESFERISQQLQKVWGTKEAIMFLDELIYNTRLEPRMGFDKAVFDELVMLRDIAHEEIKLAEVIALDTKKTSRKAKKETAMTTLNLPEIEISPEFKEIGDRLELENSQKNKPAATEEFEFELLDIATR